MDTIRESEAGVNHPGLVGSRVDRFVIVEKLGAGGMGEVFLAKDPQLNRQVALKLLKRSPTDDDQAMTRLLGEARAMAQVSHPNVVSVFDAGMHGEQPWVAMEWIRGRTLREWLTQANTWPNKLKVLCEIGRGLQAAHDAGLVHRDLKPENVLVGENGRVAVTDFGLAHGAWTDVRPELATPALPVAPRATQGSVLMGTPGYMAPEQARREKTDARTDQFAFAITAYEALYGRLPFDGEATPQSTPNPPPPSKVPARVWRAIEKGLAAKPDERHPSVAALVAELEAGIPKGGRGVGFAIAGVAVIVATGATFAMTRQHGCDQGPKLLAPTWNPTRRAAVEAALKSTSTGASVAPKLLEALDGWAGRWTSMEQQSCEATRAGSQSAALLDLREACLRRRLGDLDAVVTLLSSKGGELAVKADSAVAALPRVDGCADATTLGERLAVPAGAAAKIDALDKSLSRLKAMEDLGQFKDAVEPAKAQVASAREIGYAPALAEALVELGRSEQQVGNSKEAEATFDDAVNTAEIARDDHVRARARLLRVQLMLNLKKLDDADRELKAASAVIARVGDPALSREAKNLEAELATAQGRIDDALRLSKEGLDIAEHQVPVDERELVNAIGTYAFTLVRTAKFADAAKQYERVIPIAERVLGPKNPGLAKLTGLYVATLGKLRRLDDARPWHERTVAIINDSLGPDSAMMGEDLYNWGITLLVNRDLAGARVALEKSLEVKRKALPPEHPTIAGSINSLAVLAVEDGKYDEAAARFKEAIAIREKALGPYHPQVLNDLSDLAGAWSLGGKHAEALAVFDDILERQKKATGRQSDEAKSTILMGRAEELLQLFRFPEAKQMLAEAHPLALTSEGPDIRGRQLLLEAWSMWDGEGNKDKALSIAAEARKPVDASKDPEMMKALDGIVARIKAGKRNTK